MTNWLQFQTQRHHLEKPNLDNCNKSLFLMERIVLEQRSAAQCLAYIEGNDPQTGCVQNTSYFLLFFRLIECSSTVLCSRSPFEMGCPQTGHLALPRPLLMC